METKQKFWLKELGASLFCVAMLGLFPYPIEFISIVFTETIGSMEFLNDLPEWVYAIVEDIKWGIFSPLVSAYVSIRLFKPTSRKIFLSLPIVYLIFYEAVLITANMMELDVPYLDGMVYMVSSLICVVWLAYKFIGKSVPNPAKSG